MREGATYPIMRLKLAAYDCRICQLREKENIGV